MEFLRTTWSAGAVRLLEKVSGRDAKKQKILDSQYPKGCTKCPRDEKGKFTVYFTEEQWQQLPLVTGKDNRFPDGRKKDDVQTDEYRNCSKCGTTLVVAVAIHNLVGFEMYNK